MEIFAVSAMGYTWLFLLKVTDAMPSLTSSTSITALLQRSPYKFADLCLRTEKDTSRGMSVQNPSVPLYQKALTAGGYLSYLFSYIYAGHLHLHFFLREMVRTSKRGL